MKTLNNTWTGRNRKGEYWTNIIHGVWLMAETEEQKNIMRDIITLHKVRTINMEVFIEQLMHDLMLTYPEDLFKTENDNETLPMYKPKHLVRYLKDNNLKLTQLEVDTLECILSQGSFYEESFWGTDEEFDGSAFIGWYIDEKEVPGCRGALSSLKKKGIIDIGSDDVNGVEQACYWTKHILDFVENGYYHQLDIPQEYIKK